MFRALLNRLQPVAQRAIRVVARVFSRWCKPLGDSPLVGTIADLVRSKPQLVAENLLLRQQLIVLNRAGKRPLARAVVAEKSIRVAWAVPSHRPLTRSSQH